VYSTLGGFKFILFGISKGLKQKMIAIRLVLSNFEMHMLKNNTFSKKFQRRKLIFCKYLSVSV
jgi:hypothetical protein